MRPAATLVRVSPPPRTDRARRLRGCSSAWLEAERAKTRASLRIMMKLTTRVGIVIGVAFASIVQDVGR
ncbi:unnamed protein product [Pelagomonas calceolata]|uniref:Uncharacterized protein n=1 Tax=Pelagomonas calceolata TaxID=35677 RepID=A0A8J2SPZ7_9STRA|nr:unnamed protein product [Pelagomonas calceolata]